MSCIRTAQWKTDAGQCVGCSAAHVWRALPEHMGEPLVLTFTEHVQMPKQHRPIETLCLIQTTLEQQLERLIQI